MMPRITEYQTGWTQVLGLAEDCAGPRVPLDRISVATWLPLGIAGAELQLSLIEWFQWYLARKVNNFSN